MKKPAANNLKINNSNRRSILETQELHLTSGKYQFRVVNKNVDKDLGFVIQKEEDKSSDLMKTAIPTSFITAYVKKKEVMCTHVH